MTSNKKKIFDDTKKRFSSKTDSLGQPIDLGIVKTVAILNLLGFNTSQSCEGHKSWGNCYPWIDIKPEEDDEHIKARENLKALTNDLIEPGAQDRNTQNEISKKRLEAEKEYQKPVLELAKHITSLISKYYESGETKTYEDQLHVCFLGGSLRLQSHGCVCQPVLSELERYRKLEDYQSEMREFTEFLISYWESLEL